MSYKGINWGKILSELQEVGGFAGISLKEMGELYGVTRQRMAQVFKEYDIDPETVGVKIKRRLSREETARRYFRDKSLN